MQSTSVPTLLIRRTLDAPPQRVYDAWTQSELAQRFMCPGDMTVPEVEMDVRVGGAYRIVMQKPDGERYVARGVYREVRPAARLAMTWTWEEDTPEEEHETLLTVDFAPHGAGTELTLTHENLRNAESRTAHEEGWSSMLDKFTALR